MILIFYIHICVIVVYACDQHQTCDACIRDSAACVWCATENSLDGSRCISEKSIPLNWCSGEIKNPNSTIEEIITNTNITRQSNSEFENFFKIVPQTIKMNLRPGQTMNFSFSYNATESYPIDFYYLYDVSIKDKKWVKLLEYTDKVNKWLLNITNNAFIGLGTFVDKNALPFTAKNNNDTYSFKNQLSLSKSLKDFKRAIGNINFKHYPDNDGPNGGLDGLAQVIACDEIGWRKISRKFIVFFTDSTYHAAGDGKTAGITNPYDGGCYIKNGMYAKEKEMDYPSISIMNYLVLKREVNIIIVVPNSKAIYDYLANMINGMRVILSAPIVNNEATVTSEVDKIYQNITRSVKLNVNMNQSYEDKIKIKFNPDCETSECEVKQNSQLIIVGNITVLEYFKADDIKINISVIGIKDKLTLDVKLISECTCPMTEDVLCKNSGKRRCGVCECQPSWSGKLCECSSTNSKANQDRSTCIQPNSTVECSGRGSCVCGRCRECGERRYSGPYCECDDEICPKDTNGLLCGQGTCKCGKCICNPGWKKNAQKTCNCDKSKDKCQTGDHECSDYGNCECNGCTCSGPICDWDARDTQDLRCNAMPCHNCHNRQCQLLEAYALNRTELKTPCEGRINITSVKKLGNETTWMLCSDVRSDVGCYTKFIYRYDDDKYGIHLIIQSEPNCAESAYIYGGACLGGIIFLGILTIVGWKMLSEYRDRIEYNRVMKQHEECLKKSKPTRNDLYIAANTTITNPNYKRNSVFQ